MLLMDVVIIVLRITQYINTDFKKKLKILQKMDSMEIKPEIEIKEEIKDGTIVGVIDDSLQYENGITSEDEDDE